jgi:hypothetical protein
LAYLSEYRTLLPHELRDSDILMIISGHHSRLNFAAALIFLLNEMDLVLLPAHSSQLKSVENPLRLVNAPTANCLLRYRVYQDMRQLLLMSMIPVVPDDEDDDLEAEL